MRVKTEFWDKDTFTEWQEAYDGLNWFFALNNLVALGIASYFGSILFQLFFGISFMTNLLIWYSHIKYKKEKAIEEKQYAKN